MGTLGLALLVGVAAGAVLGAIAGARRTDSTLARVVRAQMLPDLLVNPDDSDDSAAFTQAWEGVDRLPGVEAVADLVGLTIAPVDAEGRPSFDALVNELTIANGDGDLMRTVDRPHLVSGRYADPDAANEIVINWFKARRADIRVGARVRYGMFDLTKFRADAIPPPEFVDDFEVVGIVASLDDASRAPDDPQLGSATFFTPAFAERVAGLEPPFFGKAVVAADGARGVPALEQSVRDLFAGVTVRGRPVNMNFQETALTVARARRAVRPYVLALWLFAALAAFAALGVLGQTIGRSMRPLREERDHLSALGFSRAQLLQCAVGRGLVVGSLGAVVATAIVIVSSAWTPIGPLRGIDPARGVDVDLGVVLAGVLVVVGLVVAVAVVAVRPRRRGRAPVRGSVLANRLAGAGAPVSVVSGVRFALDRGRDRDVPLRSTLLGITVAAAAIVATVVYGSGLTRFTGTPVRYGWPWTYQLEIDTESTNTSAAAAALAATRGVGAIAAGYYSQFDIRGRSVAAIGIDRSPGVPFLPLLSGRGPESADEIVLGEKTMQSVDARIGDRLRVTAQSGTRDFTVVGTAVFPRFAPYPASEPTGLGIGAATTAAAIRSLDAELGSPFFLVQARDGEALSRGALLPAAGVLPDEGSVLGPQRPNDVLSYDRLSVTPIVLTGVLVVLALGSAVHLLVSGVRSHRRDIALLKTMGFTRGSARRAIFIQATVLISIALAIAIPVGVLAGRWLWILTARWLGIADDASIPVALIGLVAVIAVAVANLVALGPAVVAAHTRPAVALRSE
jgi:ABC-type lipoprotein release transport system permease subunit